MLTMYVRPVRDKAAANPYTAVFYISLAHADVLKVGVWQLLQKVEDPELKRLADSGGMAVAAGSERP